MTEGDIRHALYWERLYSAAAPMMVPNVYLWRWESDLIYLSRNYYATEYEIKTTRSDFKADFKKVMKHQQLSGHVTGPTYFYYACPKGLIDADEVPDYAGLIHTEGPGKTWEIKRPPRRRVAPLTGRQRMELLSKGVARYWSLWEHTHNTRRAR